MCREKNRIVSRWVWVAAILAPLVLTTAYGGSAAHESVEQEAAPALTLATTPTPPEEISLRQLGLRVCVTEDGAIPLRLELLITSATVSMYMLRELSHLNYPGNVVTPPVE